MEVTEPGDVAVEAMRVVGSGAVRSDQPWEILLLDEAQNPVGQLRFRACTECRAGRILDLWIGDDVRRQGLGREALHSLLALHPRYRWSTTLKSRQGGRFFATMTCETSMTFPTGGPLCPHLRGWFSRICHHVTGRWASP